MQTKKTPSRASVSWILPTVLLCGFAYCGTFAADAKSSSAVHKVAHSVQKLELKDTDSVLVQFPDWLTRVQSGNADLIRITAIKPDCVRVTCLGDGQTTLKAVDRQQREYSVELSLVTTNRH